MIGFEQLHRAAQTKIAAHLTRELQATAVDDRAAVAGQPRRVGPTRRAARSSPAPRPASHESESACPSVANPADPSAIPSRDDVAAPAGRAPGAPFTAPSSGVASAARSTPVPFPVFIPQPAAPDRSRPRRDDELQQGQCRRARQRDREHPVPHRRRLPAQQRDGAECQRDDHGDFGRPVEQRDHAVHFEPSFLRCLPPSR